MSELIPGKLEMFVRAFLENDRCGSRAYRKVYPCEGLTPLQIAKKAHKVRSRPHVRQRINELEAEIADRFLATQAERRAHLWDIAKTTKYEKPDTSVKATAELNKMDPSLRAPVMQVNADGPVRIELHPSLIDRQLDRDDSAPVIERE